MHTKQNVQHKSINIYMRRKHHTLEETTNERTTRPHRPKKSIHKK